MSFLPSHTVCADCGEEGNSLFGDPKEPCRICHSKAGALTFIDRKDAARQSKALRCLYRSGAPATLRREAYALYRAGDAELKTAGLPELEALAVARQPALDLLRTCGLLSDRPRWIGGGTQRILRLRGRRIG